MTLIVFGKLVLDFLIIFWLLMAASPVLAVCVNLMKKPIARLSLKGASIKFMLCRSQVSEFRTNKLHACSIPIFFGTTWLCM